jgi:hypothetical protein
MTINPHISNEISSYNKNKLIGEQLVLYLMQIMTLCNAIKDGWKIKKIGSRKYEMTKKINDDDFHLKDLLIKLIK